MCVSLIERHNLFKTMDLSAISAWPNISGYPCPASDSEAEKISPSSPQWLGHHSRVWVERTKGRKRGEVFGPVAGTSHDFCIFLVISDNVLKMEIWFIPKLAGMVGNLNYWECHDMEAPELSGRVQDPFPLTQVGDTDTSHTFFETPLQFVTYIYRHQSLDPILSISIQRVLPDLNIFWISICWLLRLLFSAHGISWHFMPYFDRNSSRAKFTSSTSKRFTSVELKQHMKKMWRGSSIYGPSQASLYHYNIRVSVYIYKYTVLLHSCLILLNPEVTKRLSRFIVNLLHYVL